MSATQRLVDTRTSRDAVRPRAFVADLALYLAVVFLVREVYFPQVGFIANGLFWSLTTLVVAAWRMKARAVSWTDLGLRRPENPTVALVATGAILGLAIASIVAFEIAKDQLGLQIVVDNSNVNAVSRFGDLQGNWIEFLSIFPFVWLESLLEEGTQRDTRLRRW